MRTIIKLLIISIILISTGCNQVPIERYCSGIIISKSHKLTGYKIRLKYDGIITNNIYITKYDYERFNIGDTIKCSNETYNLYKLK